MKSFTTAVEIDLPRDRILEIFEDKSTYPMWMRGFEKFEHVSGEPGRKDAVSEITMRCGKKPMVMTETIIDRSLPDAFDANYEWGAGWNSYNNRFTELEGGRTRWECTCGYEFRKLFLKIIGAVAPGMFRKENQKFMNDFKAYCEHGTDVRDEKK